MKSTPAASKVEKRLPRQSNFELLRIVAMLMVLGLHVNFYSFGAPDSDSLGASGPFVAWGREFLEYLCICAVDVFVLISGWFGMRVQRDGVMKFVFLVLFWRFVIACVWLGSFWPGFVTAVKAFPMLMFDRPEWFALSWIVLMLVAPMANAWIERLSAREFKVWLILFYALILVYGWVKQYSEYFSYTPVMLLFLYMLGRYMRLHMRFPRLGLAAWMAMFVGLQIIISTCAYFLIPSAGLSNAWYSHMTNYNGPTVILSAVLLFQAFGSLNFASRFVNSVAANTFAVYVIHCNPFVLPFFVETAKGIAAAYTPALAFAAMLAYVLLVFTLCILGDKVRAAVWNALSPHIRFGRFAALMKI